MRTTYRPWKAEAGTFISHCLADPNDLTTLTADPDFATCTCDGDFWYDIDAFGEGNPVGCAAHPVCGAGQEPNPLFYYQCGYPEDCHATAELFNMDVYECEMSPAHECEVLGQYDLYGTCVDHCEIQFDLSVDYTHHELSVCQCASTDEQ